MQRQDHGRDGGDGGATQARTAGEEPPLRLAAIRHHCGLCGAQAATGDTFCTSCGHPLPDTHVEAAAETAVLPMPPAENRTPAPPSPLVHPGARRSARVPILAAFAGLLLAAAVTFAVLWHRETNHAAQLQQRLDRTTLTLEQTRSTLASTHAKLAATSALSAKRQAVLLKAQAVLKKVDPLLSSVDGVQQGATDLQSQGTTLSTDAESLIQTTVTLVNYLVDWGSDADTTYVNGLIDEANSELNTVRVDEASFGGDTTAYNKASAAFGQKADAFSSAVRSLQTQLKGVSGP